MKRIDSKIKFYKVLVVLVFLIAGEVSADMMANLPRPWVSTSENNQFSFTMLPGRLGGEPRGFAVKHMDDGANAIHWSTSGWYGFNGYLTPDGEHLVTHADNQIYVDRSDIENIVIVRFHRKGKLLKAYTLGDLMTEVGSVRRSVSHVYWMAQTYGYRIYGLEGNEFTMVTAEKNRYVFDIRDGSIISVERDDELRTLQDIEQEKQRDAIKNGAELFYSSEIRSEYEQLFTVSDMNVVGGSIMGVHFDGRQWSANLLPLDDSLKDCKVKAVFPRQGDKRLLVSLKAEEVIQACRSILSNEYILNRFGGDQLDLRIRITGDRLHWNTNELVEGLADTGRQLSRGKVPIYWTQGIVTTEDPDRRYFSFYLNSTTGDIVFEDKDTEFPYSSTYVQSGH